VRQALDLVGLHGLEDRPASRLSGGQQQRVALARALVYHPRVLLLDEPLSNLDAELRARLRFELKEIQRRTGVTAVYVTHDQSEAVVLGDQVGVMEAGRLVQFCSPAELYTHPANTFVAAFTGASNILKAAVCEVTGDGMVSRTEGGLMVRSCRAVDVGQKRDVWVAFRPENTALRAGPSGAEPNAWAGRITRADFLGAQTRYSVTTHDIEVIAIRSGSIQEFSVGDQVVVSVPPPAVSVLTE
jgi:iron(III) transport system ATP-binding protein